MKTLLLGISLLAGCSDTKKPATVDAMSDGNHTIPATISITSFGDPPKLLAVRVAGGAWQALDVTATEFAVDGPSYQLLAVCHRSTRYDVGIAARMVADGSSVTQPCIAFAGITPGTPVAIGGMMKQAGDVWLGSQDSSTASPWTFALDAEAGDHELIAHGAGKWMVRSGVAIAGPTTLTTVDLDTEGTAQHDVAFDLTGAGTDAVSTEVDWLTDHEFAYTDVVGVTAGLPADAILGGNDLLFIDVSADSGAEAWRDLEYFYTPGTTPVTAYTLLPKLAGITFTGTSTAWAAPLPAGNVRFDMTRTSDYARYSLSASPTYLAGETGMAIDLASVPGWMTAWDLDPNAATKSLTVTVDQGDATLISAFYGATALRKPHRAAELRARRRR